MAARPHTSLDSFLPSTPTSPQRPGRSGSAGTVCPLHLFPQLGNCRDASKAGSFQQDVAVRPGAGAQYSHSKRACAGLCAPRLCTHTHHTHRCTQEHAHRELHPQAHTCTCTHRHMLTGTGTHVSAHVHTGTHTYRAAHTGTHAHTGVI